MRIKGVGAETAPPVNERGETVAGTGGKAGFTQVLREQEAKLAGGWEELLNQVDERAKQLLNQPSTENLRLYREAVRAFLKDALRGSFRMKGESRWDRRGNRRVFCVVEKINKALEELTAAVLKKNQEAIDVMAKIDEIRGLLIDLYY